MKRIVRKLESKRKLRNIRSYELGSIEYVDERFLYSSNFKELNKDNIYGCKKVIESDKG